MACFMSKSFHPLLLDAMLIVIKILNYLIKVALFQLLIKLHVFFFILSINQFRYIIISSTVIFWVALIAVLSLVISGWKLLSVWNRDILKTALRIFSSSTLLSVISWLAIIHLVLVVSLCFKKISIKWLMVILSSLTTKHKTWSHFLNSHPPLTFLTVASEDCSTKQLSIGVVFRSYQLKCISWLVH